MSRHMVRAVVSFEYVASTQAYGVVDPKALAEVDRVAYEAGEFPLAMLEDSAEVKIVSWEVGEELVEGS